MKLILSIDVLRSANLCAGVNDVRHYLNGIHIRNNKVESTNGQVLYMAKNAVLSNVEWFDNDYHKGDFIIKIENKIPKSKKISYASIESDGDDKFIIRYLCNFGSQIDIGMGTLVDGKFPDIPKLISTIRKLDKSSDSVGVNTNYLGLINNVFNRGHEFPVVKFELFGEKSGFIVTNKSVQDEFINGNELMVVMPVTL